METTRFRDRHGQTWTMTKVALGEEADEADFSFWYDNLTPEERVAEIAECWKAYEQTKGIVRGVPRFARLCRRTQRP